jgi:hypothetical protein
MSKTITLRPSDQQGISWANAARRLHKSVPAYVAFAASWTARYFREVDRRKYPDWAAFRMDEKAKLGKLLEAAKQAVPYVPRFVDHRIQGRVFLQETLRRAVDAVEEHLASHDEDWTC